MAGCMVVSSGAGVRRCPEGAGRRCAAPVRTLFCGCYRRSGLLPLLVVPCGGWGWLASGYGRGSGGRVCRGRWGRAGGGIAGPGGGRVGDRRAGWGGTADVAGVGRAAGGGG